MGKDKPGKDNVDRSIDDRRVKKIVEKAGKIPVPPMSDKLKNAKPWEDNDDAS